MESLLENRDENKEVLAIRNQAYKYLAIRDHFSSELRKKLLNKGYSQDLCDIMIAELTEENLLNDYEVAMKFAENKLQIEGKIKVYMRLVQKGVSKDIAQRALDDCDVDEREVCIRVLDKKIESLGIDGKLSEKEEIKLVNFLKSRGFSTTCIYLAIRTQDMV